MKFTQKKMDEKTADIALPVLHRLLKETPRIPSLWNNIALCDMHQGKKQLVLEYAQGALKQDEDYLPTKHNEAMVEGQIIHAQSIWTIGNTI